MMKDLLKKLQKKSNKKGFTLVEIIVVLVILAILAAIAVPSVLGYVNEAKEERYIQEARSIYVVIQTEEAKATALNETVDYAAIATKAQQMTNLNPVTSIKKEGDKYTIVWSSDDGKNIT
ncbi:type II secretion system protein, partial [Faecalibacillus intestinalis]